MNKVEILRLLRECVAETTGVFMETIEGSDGYFSYLTHCYIDADKMIAVIDARLKSERKSEARSVGPDAW